ncbi:MAG: hypothetical protein IPK60_09205 [Sandaracinaceae bacterium]|nr:hypothetical protein [Sandaracinaceae bacterium]
MSAVLLRVYLVFALCVVVGTMTLGIRESRVLGDAVTQASQHSPGPRDRSATNTAAQWPAHVSWIAAGGGPTPEFNQLSLESDLALASGVFGAEEGVVLFAGGPGSRAVQVLDSEERGDDLRMALAEFFDARQGRDAHYEAVSIPTLGAATREATLDAIRRALEGGPANSPLTVFLVGHGDRGDVPGDASLSMWGDGVIHPADLATLFDKYQREHPVRYVVTSCYSGGFSEALYTGAKINRRVTNFDRCGFFASTWTEQASGCDPNPDRGAHQGYAVNFLHALRGEDRSGHAIARTEIDFNRDGAVSFLEAHTYASLSSASIDIPTTTSQSYLRDVAPPADGGGDVAPAMPENDAIIATLAARLGLAGRDEEARNELATRELMINALRRDSEAAADEENAAYERAAAVLLGRYPVLDDPWHPDFEATLRNNEDDIIAFFESAREIAAWQQAQEVSADVAERLELLTVDIAPYRRFSRALEDRELAARLHRLGGLTWTRYERFLA